MGRYQLFPMGHQLLPLRGGCQNAVLWEEQQFNRKGLLGGEQLSKLLDVIVFGLGLNPVEGSNLLSSFFVVGNQGAEIVNKDHFEVIVARFSEGSEETGAVSGAE
jgi:hypothetical protein